MRPRGAFISVEIVLPLRKTCYYSPLAEVGVFSTEINTNGFFQNIPIVRKNLIPQDQFPAG
ncbi:hypothetical protein DXB15_14650 [Roseburia sp. OM02-15]|nr:hypothetical protein DXB15_14650 [Roseburia sp. OM02-15]